MNRGWLILTIIEAFLLLGAASASHSAEQSIQGSVRWIYPTSDGNFVVATVPDAPSCTSANSPKYMYAVVGQNGMTSEGSKKIYAAAMLAMASSRQVTVIFDVTTQSCYINRVIVVN